MSRWNVHSRLGWAVELFSRSVVQPFIPGLDEWLVVAFRSRWAVGGYFQVWLSGWVVAFRLG